jgi:hypothetical protein
MYMAIVSLLFGAGSYYFFSQGRYILGSLFLLWACMGLFGEPVGNFFGAVALSNRYFHIERDCNVSLEIGINVEEVVRHPAVVRVFERLREKNAVRDTSHAEWAQRLLDHYKRRHANASLRETVRFYIKSNLVWKNSQMDFSDAIWHEIFIPYESAGGAEAEYAPGFPPSLETGLTIRLILANGILKLQAGDYSKEISPNKFTGLGAEVYRARETITSFPLLYFPSQHRLPDRYMNFTSLGTESHHKAYAETPAERKKSTKEWMKVYREVRKYLYVCKIPKEHVPHILEGPRWEKIIQEFDRKKEEWLRREGFAQLPADSRDPGGADASIRYENACLRVVVINYGDRDHGDVNQKLHKRIVSDYVIEEGS